jgi:hypothetical protein
VAGRIDAGFGTGDRRLGYRVLRARRHMSAGVVAEALARLPASLRELLEPPAAQPAAGSNR